MHSKNLVILSILVLSQLFLQTCTGQGTNLLQRYIQQYFKDYYPSTIRQYTLYGNGQNGAADYHAGLPYPYEKSGKVNSVIYSNSANPPLAPPRASAKKTAGLVENAWAYPGPMNNLNPAIPPQDNNGFNNGQQQFPFPEQSRSDTPVQILQMQQIPGGGGVLIMDPQQAEPYQPMAESRMVEEQDPEMPIMTNENFNGDGYAEIPVQSAMAF